MIKHIVIWQFNENEEENMYKLFDKLKGLVGVIPELKSLETHVNINPANDNDAILITEFDSLEDLNAYKVDPRHAEVSKFCKTIRKARCAIDYEF